MKIQSVKKSKSNYFLLSVIFLFICSFSSLFSQTKDTLWTRLMWPYRLQNAVFSPDDKFIYVTAVKNDNGTPPYYLLKYDLQGNQLWESDTLGGIRQFSEDGQFFWNYFGEKYDANTFRKLYLFDNGEFKSINWKYWDFKINEKSNFGVLCGEGTVNETEFQNFFDSNLIVFELTSMVVQKVTSHPDKAYWLSHPTINSDGTNLAIIAGVEKRNNEAGYYTDSVHIEIWRIPTLEKVAKIQLEKSKGSLPVILKYSPDGSVLGYQHDGNLTLYSTTDYSVQWEKNGINIQNFSWSNDMNYIYYSTGTLGLFKLDNSTKEIIYNYQNMNSSQFIEINLIKNLILCSHNKKWLCLLDNTITSVSDPIFKENYKTTITQNQTTNEFTFEINAPEPAVGNYTISNMLGEILQNPIQINISEGFNQFELNTTDFPSGIYFLTLTISGRTQTLKFGVIK